MNSRITVGVIAVILVLPFMVQSSQAHGIISVKDCNAVNLAYNQELYREDIIGINQAASLYVDGHPNYTMGRLAGYMDNVYLNQPVEIAHCLRDLGINPVLVAQLSPLAYSALVYDRAQLQGYSPNFLKEIPAPQVDLAQNIQPIPHQVQPIQKETVQAGNQPLPAEPGIVQAVGEPAQSMPVAVQKNQQQVPMEYVFVAIAAAVASGMAIIFGKRTKKDHRIPLLHQR